MEGLVRGLRFGDRARNVDVTIRGAMCPKSPWPEGGKIWKPKLMGLAAGLETGWIQPRDLGEMDLAA